ncbi:carbonic anhydrase domain protein [Campylobacter insulaenigrae]|nr:carbonic anhydrase domain protein [Campylobacter insulaenigrae]
MNQNEVDGKFIKNLEHGMGIPMKLLIKKHLPDILKEKVKDKTCKKEISYKSDDLIYTFKEKDDKILLEVKACL